MVSLNQFFALTANSIQNLVAFSRSIGVFKTCIFICDAESAVSIKNVKLNYKFCHLIEYLNSIRQCCKTSNQHSGTRFISLKFFLQFLALQFLSPMFPPSLPRSCSTQQSGFHLHACTLLFKRVWVSVVHSPRTPNCAHTCLSNTPPRPHLLALKRSQIKSSVFFPNCKT